MEFEREKATANLDKRGVSFGEASKVFGDPLTLTVYDPDHSETEDRFITIGVLSSHPPQTIVVAHTDHDGRIRVISARPATSREKRFYDQENRVDG